MGKYIKKLTDNRGRHNNHLSGENSPRWVGDKITYSGVHKWIKRVAGSAKDCMECGILDAKRYEWENISGEYRRDLSDWKQLCCSCHRRFDDIGNKVWAARRSKL